MLETDAASGSDKTYKFLGKAFNCLACVKCSYYIYETSV